MGGSGLKMDFCRKPGRHYQKPDVTLDDWVERNATLVPNVARVTLGGVDPEKHTIPLFSTTRTPTVPQFDTLVADTMRTTMSKTRGSADGYIGVWNFHSLSDSIVTLDN